MKKAKGFEHVLTMVKENDPHYHILDLKKSYLIAGQIVELADAMQKNSMINNVLWHQDQEKNEHQLKINSTVLENFNNNYNIITDYEHALLSKHVYLGEEIKLANGDLIEHVKIDDGKEQKLSQGWQVHQVYKDQASSYYGVAYRNDIKHKIVLAHRGTIIDPNDLLKKDSVLKTDLKGVLGQAIVRELREVYKSTEDIIKWVKDQAIPYEFSTTGHSLGAWLAEHSVYFSCYKFDYKNIRAVTFDSPGSYEMFKKFESNIIGNHGINLKTLDITTYLSEPNIVNICNKHVGNVYRIFPDIKPSQIQKIIDAYVKPLGISKLEGTIRALYSIETHSLTKIIETFDAKTGSPLIYKEVFDWPHLKYEPDTSSKSVFTKIVNWATGIPLVSSFIKQYIDEYTIGTVLNVLDDFIQGTLDLKEYFITMKVIDNDTNQDPDASFKLTVEGHYHVKPATTPYQIALKSNSKEHKFVLEADKMQETLMAKIKCDGNTKLKELAELFFSSHSITKHHNHDFLQSQGKISTDIILRLAGELNHWWIKAEGKDLHYELKLIGTGGSSKLGMEGKQEPLQGYCLNQPSTWVDFNGDGKIDLTCSNKAGTHAVLLSTGLAFNRLPGGLNNIVTDWCTKSKNEYVQWVDFNGDGKMDLACDSANGKHSILLSDGTVVKSPNSDPKGELKLQIEGKEEQALNNVCPSKPDKELNWIDFNGDGKMDLICSDTTVGRHYVFLSTGTALKSANQYPGGILYNIENPKKPLENWCTKKDNVCDAKSTCTKTPSKIAGELKFADFNGDGKVDFICSDIEAGKHHVLLSTGTALQSPKQSTLTSPACDPKGMEWIDFNGDGTADFTCRGQGGEYYVLLSKDGALRSPNADTQGKVQILGDIAESSKSCTKENTAWIDLNGDNKADLICYMKPDYYALLSTGRAFDFKTVSLPKHPSEPLCINGGQHQLSWVDFNSDEFVDLACSTASGTHSVLLGWCELS